MSGTTKWWVKDRTPEPDLESLKKAELVALAEERDIDTSGTKADLVERLEEAASDE